jgi:hypothetical protein
MRRGLAGVAVGAATILAASMAVAEAETDCEMGEVRFVTAGVERTLLLRMHEQRVEIPAGLFRIAELPPLGGVFSVYPEPRERRTLQNSDVLAADLMTFGQDGSTLALMRDATGVALDQMETPDGMLYAAYLAGGTIDAMGFDMTTRYLDWRCTD